MNEWVAPVLLQHATQIADKVSTVKQQQEKTIRMKSKNVCMLQVTQNTQQL